MANPARISVAVPSHEHVPFMFSYDLAQMYGYSVAALDGRIVMGLNAVTGTYVQTARQQLLEALLEQGVTHILWLDSDMRFPRDALIRLLAHNLPVVGINYAQRGVPSDFVAIKQFNGEKLFTGPDSHGLEEVEGLGFGMVLMQTKFLKDLGPKPWFRFEYLEDGKQVGEDIYFCKLLRERLGLTLWVDHDLSKECAHIGQFEYTLEQAQAERELQEA